ncbi:unnamed protein product [Pleuronectes platessa]|uniref:Uncharacterized protein n=1 Tax=Pleuronectes platessa TaxID=8262 RepID=A0A9N7ZA38_PLEPL|nr:unnamed protein product [Pleuronectes platessa]
MLPVRLPAGGELTDRAGGPLEGTADRPRHGSQAGGPRWKLRPSMKSFGQDDGLLGCGAAARNPAGLPPSADVALCFPDNRLRSSSAHQRSVISIHNNTAAWETWQEAGAPNLSAFGEKEEKSLFEDRLLSPPGGLASYYFPHTAPVLSAGGDTAVVVSPPPCPR